VLALPDLPVNDESLVEQKDNFLRSVQEIARNYKKSQQFRQKLQVISRGMKPKQHRSLRHNMARSLVRV